MDCSAGAVVYKMEDGQPRYLLVLSGDREYWGFPKGHLEPDEMLEQTIAREVREETGCEIDIVNGFQHEMHYVLPNGGKKTVVLKLAQGKGELPIELPNDEIAEVRWCSYGEALRLMGYEDTKRALNEAHMFLRLKRG